MGGRNTHHHGHRAVLLQLDHHNYYLGENALTFITENPAFLHGLRLVVVAVVFLGAVAPGATAVFFFPIR